MANESPQSHPWLDKANPLSEELLRTLDPAFLGSKWFLNWMWKSMIFSFGLTIFLIAGYYLVVMIFHVKHLCQPGEEFAIPGNEEERTVGLVVMAITTAVLYGVSIYTALVFIVLLTHCGTILTFVINFGDCKGFVGL